MPHVVLVQPEFVPQCEYHVATAGVQDPAGDLLAFEASCNKGVLKELFSDAAGDLLA